MIQWFKKIIQKPQNRQASTSDGGASLDGTSNVLHIMGTEGDDTPKYRKIRKRKNVRKKNKQQKRRS